MGGKGEGRDALLCDLHVFHICNRVLGVWRRPTSGDGKTSGIIGRRSPLPVVMFWRCVGTVGKAGGITTSP